MRHLIPLSMIAALAACSNEPAAVVEPSPEQQIAEAEAAEEVREQTVAASETLSGAQSFIDEVVKAGAIQIGLAQIAAEQAGREDVQAFAEQSIDLHRTMLADLSTAAETAAEDLDVNTTLTEEEKRTFAQLRGARSIDDMYLERTRSAYRGLAGDLDTYAESGEVEELRSWAEAAATRLSEHRDDLTAI